MSDALYVLRHSITGGKAPLQYCKNAVTALLPGEILFTVVAFSFLLLMLFDWANERGDAIEAVSALLMPARWSIYICFMLALILLIPRDSTAPFIYFQF